MKCEFSIAILLGAIHVLKAGIDFPTAASSTSPDGRWTLTCKRSDEVVNDLRQILLLTGHGRTVEIRRIDRDSSVLWSPDSSRFALTGRFASDRSDKRGTKEKPIKHLRHPQLPAEVTINQEAGRGGLLLVTLRLKSGQELPFILDTGSPGTLFDRSLVPQLGRRLPLGTWTIRTPVGNQKSGIYWRPKLYLGNTRLKTGSLVATFDFKQLSNQVGHPIMGILAMDCLKHYCIQLDFQEGKMRFLDRNQLDMATLGKPFPLKLSLFRQLILHHASLAGGKSTKLLIDTGWVSDGGVERGAIKGYASGWVHLPECVWDSQAYTNVTVENGANVIGLRFGNVIGLRFLARHLVTFDFPNRTMFLKQTSVGPLLGDLETKKEKTALAIAESAFKFLKDLKEKGQLPGWSNSDKGTANQFEVSPTSVTFHGHKEGAPSIYYYTVIRMAKDSGWKLQKAWRADESGKMLEEYPVPASTN